MILITIRLLSFLKKMLRLDVLILIATKQRLAMFCSNENKLTENSRTGHGGGIAIYKAIIVKKAVESSNKAVYK